MRSQIFGEKNTYRALNVLLKKVCTSKLAFKNTFFSKYIKGTTEEKNQEMSSKEEHPGGTARLLDCRSHLSTLTCVEVLLTLILLI